MKNNGNEAKKQFTLLNQIGHLTGEGGKGRKGPQKTCYHKQSALWGCPGKSCKKAQNDAHNKPSQPVYGQCTQGKGCKHGIKQRICHPPQEGPRTGANAD